MRRILNQPPFFLQTLQRININAFLFCFIASALFLNGCAPVPTQTHLPSDEAWEVQQNELNTFNRWQLSGRIGFRTPDNGTSASLQWAQTHNAYQIQLFGPFGAGALQIDGIGNTFQVSSNEGVLNQKEAKDYLKRTFGIDIPLAELSYWVKGLPAPKIPHKLSLNNQGQLKELFQSNWQINYDGYNQQQPSTPNKINMARDGLKIKLIVHEWKT